MAKQNLLLVDADLRSLRVLEVSLRKAGYNVASTGNARDALAMLEVSRPDLVLCDTRLPEEHGFELIQEIRRNPELADIPLMVLSSDVSVETKVRGLELGVEEYLTKPIYIKELLARVNIVLQRKHREGIEHLGQSGKRRFSGSLSDMGVVDLLQAIDNSKKSGVLYLSSRSAQGAIYFCNGAPIDAELDRLRGVRAIYRALVWTEGTFEIDFRELNREDVLQTSMQGVLMEGMRRLDEWGRLLEQLPDLDNIFEVSDTQLIARLAEIPDEINKVLREFDGERSLLQIVDACEEDDLETLTAVSKLYFEGLIYNTGRRPGPSILAVPSEPEPMELSEIVLPHISSGPPVITHTLAPAWPSSAARADAGQPWLRGAETPELSIPSAPKLPTPSHAMVDRFVSARASGHPLTRRKARRRKKRHAPALTTLSSLQAQGLSEPLELEHSEELEVDESCAEITPSSVAPPPADLTLRATSIAYAPSAPPLANKTSKPPKLPPRASAAPEALPTSVVALHLSTTETTSGFPLAAISPVPVNDAGEPAGARIAQQRGEEHAEVAGASSPPPSEPSALTPVERTLSPAPAPAPAAGEPEPPPDRTSGADTANEPTGERAASTDQPSVAIASATSPPISEAPRPSREPLAAPAPAQPESAAAASAVSAPPPLPNSLPAALSPSRSPRQVSLSAPAAPPKSKTMPRLVIGLAAAAALAAGVFALSVRDTTPQASLIKAVPKPAPEASVPKPPHEPTPPPADPPPIAAEPEASQPPASSAPSPARPQAMQPKAEAEHPAAGAPPESSEGKPAAAPADAAQALAKGRDLEEQGKTDQALELYQRALATADGGSQLLSRMAFVYLNQGKDALAAAHAERAARADETNSEAWIVLGAAQFQLGKKQAAQQAYRSCAAKGKGQYVTECRRMLR